MSTQKASRSRTPHRATQRASRSHAQTMHHSSVADAFSGTTVVSIVLFAVALTIALLAWNAFMR